MEEFIELFHALFKTKYKKDSKEQLVYLRQSS